LSEASDWYAYGVMLYEALTGYLPFEGTLYEIMRAKLEHEPPPLDPAHVSPRLATLCTALLSRDPAARPKGPEILAQLTAADTSGETTIEQTLQTETESHSRSGAAFFGREAELAQLSNALRDAETGSSVVLHVRGLSGSGKSSLIEEFLGRLEARRGGLGQFSTLVLRSRCYEREALPFKALDGVIDALCRHLSQLDDIEVSNLVPGDVAALAQLFPVLERLRAVQRLMSSRAGAGAVQSRQRAEAALRELFRRLAGRQPVVVWIDDLQWGDLDSAGILSSWFQQGADQPLLFVLSYRSDEVSTSPCLQTLLSPAAPSGARILDVTSLSAQDVAALCWSKLGAHTRERDALVSRIVREAQGSPFLAAQLATLTEAKLRQGPVEENTISVARLIGQTADLLSTEARLLLRVLAVAGRPIAPKLAFRAAGIRHGGRELVHTLRGLQLVRTREVAGDRWLETYHDRVRESVQRQLEANESQRLHANLLRALEFSGSADPDWLHQHALGAGERDAAYRYGRAAAERAMTTLAFARAAELFTRCLELSDAPPEERGKLLQRLAAAHDYCGHGSRAADAYLEAVHLAKNEESAPLLRLATAHLLSSGRFAEGEVLLARLLDTLGQRVPQSTWGLLLALIWERVRLAVRGHKYVRRDASEVPPALLARIDAFDALYQSTIALYPLRAALFMAKSMRWALEAGEPNRVLNALGQLWYTTVISGKRAARRAEALRTQALALAAELDKPSARAVVLATDAISNFMLARFSEVIPASREAERLYREHATSQRDASYQMRLSVVTVRLGALYATGDFQTFITEVTSAVAEARATEDVAAQLILSLNETLIDHLNGRGDEAIQRLDRQSKQLPTTSFGFYHALHLVASCEVGCWTGRLDWARAVLEREWPRAVRSGLLRVPSFASLLHAGRLRVLVNQQLRAKQTDAKLEQEIARTVSAMAKVPGARFYAGVESARLCYGRGDRDGASALLRRAMTEVASGMELERARYLLAFMVDDEASRSELQAIEGRLKAQGIDPRVYMGGFFFELFQQS
jgi:hypothetical protein